MDRPPAAGSHPLAEPVERLAHVLAEAVIVTDAAGRMLYLNRAIEKIFGFEIASLLGDDVRLLIPDFADAVKLARTKSGEELIQELPGVTRANNELALEVRLIPHESPPSPSSRWTVVALDITAQRILEAQLRESQKFEAVGRLAGGVAHEFNNLLTIIAGHADALMKHIGTRNRLRGVVREIRNAADRAGIVSRQLLAFSRHHVPAPQQLDLNSIVGTMEKMLRRMIGEDIELVTVLQLGLDRVKADPAQIEQVILSLAAQAREAMRNGGTLTIETANVNLDGRQPEPAGVTGPHVMLTVKDTGPAQPELQGALFDGLRSAARRSSRAGLTLATVIGIASEANGHMTVTSTPDVGTAIRLYLPRSQESAELIDLDDARRFQARGTETLLLVEDEEAVRRVVRSILERRGYTVIEAASGLEALSAFDDYADEVDLLITDIVMPRMSGRELASRLTALRPDLRVLFISGYVDDSVKPQELFTLTSHFLQKPFTPDALTAKVREVLHPEGSRESDDADGARHAEDSSEPEPPHRPSRAEFIRFPARGHSND
jgi:two-component system cell cycle sensor histidine kinase/response regulator CckA